MERYRLSMKIFGRAELSRAEEKQIQDQLDVRSDALAFLKAR